MYIQVAVHAPLSLLLLPEARSLQSPCRRTLQVQLILILCCGVASALYDCSHTADMHDRVMKGVTCYKDASDHDRVGIAVPRWRVARIGQQLTPFRCGGLLLSLPGTSTPPHQGASLNPGGVGALSTWPSLTRALLLTRVSAPLLVAFYTWSSLTRASISFPKTYFYYMKTYFYYMFLS